MSPTIVPVKQATIVPETSVLGPNDNRSARRSGANALTPPINIPKLPKFVNPQRA